MTDTTSNRFNATGTTAERLAFTPTPGTPASGPDQGYTWWDTDLKALFAYDFVLAAWKVTVGTINFILDGGGSAITTGVKLDLGPWDFDITLSAVTALADQSGSIVLDLWMDTYANYPPTIADTIVASAPITISTATKSQDTTLTGWTVSIPAGRTIRVNVNSVTSITRLGVAMKYTR